MKKFLILILLLLSSSALAGGLNASFQNSRFQCPNDPSLIFCSKGVVDGSNNLIDYTENLFTDRTEFDDWSQVGTCAVTADQWRNPVDGTVDADLLDNTGGAVGDYRYLSSGLMLGLCTGSVWIRSDYNHTCTIRLHDVAAGYFATEHISVTNTWRRFSVSGVSSGAANVVMVVHPGEQGVSTGTAYFYGAQLVENDRYLPNMGIFINPSDQAITKPRHDLADSNDPTPAFAHLQSGGNKMPAREYDGVNQSYSKAHHNSMNVFDGDHTITFLFERTDTGASDFRRIFGHGFWQADGIYIQHRYATGQFTAVYSNIGSTASVNAPADMGTNTNLHIGQIVRRSNTATFYTGGVAGTPVDVTGYGIDGARTMYLGYDGAGNRWEGTISHTRIRSRALSLDELAEEREEILGIATNWSAVNAWDFERTTVGYKQFSAGGANALVSHMSEVAVDHPRVAGKGSGLLIEGQSTNLAMYSQGLDDAVWGKTRLSVVANSAVALDGTTTADTLHEDATAANTHFATDSLTVTDTNTYTLSAYVRENNRSWAWLVNSGGNIAGYFNLSNCTLGTVTAPCTADITSEPNGWCRCSVTCAATSSTYHVAIGPADGDGGASFNGLNQDSIYVWNMQLEEMPFATSPILTLATAVTRTADDMTIDPSPDGTNEYILPLTFAPNTNADKLTVYAEFKCEWGGSADIGAVNRRLLTITGNGGTALWNRNALLVRVTTAGSIQTYFYDDSSTAHHVTSAVDVVDYSEWFTYRAVIDFSDFSRMDHWIDGTSDITTSAGLAGAATFDTTGTMIRVGQQYDGTVNGFCHIRNLRINGREIRP